MTALLVSIMHFSLIIMFFLNGIQVFARRHRHKGSDSSYETISCSEGSCDESSEEATYSSSEEEYGIRKLKNRLRVLSKEVCSLYETKATITSKLLTCQKMSDYSVREDPKECRYANAKYDEYEEEREENIKITKRITIYSLRRLKNTIENDIKLLTNLLQKCEVKPIMPIKKFVIRTKKVGWVEAVNRCLSENKQIASITSQREQNDFARTRREQGGEAYYYTWIGGYRFDTSSKFYWVGSKLAPFTYTKWYDSSGSDNCNLSWRSYENYGWGPHPCSNSYNYACEYYE